ncbi:quinohemoprotein amine dehydrogenase subunit beta [Antarctobacter sp.]|uniref:quinohemoprotein amine dehydrogenase subunit beta n=1 Tax=Antarctobacter sp. TaxID=1872577 RepID=UPI002B275673|nr:quinohemoprotein amine dehydrogenase subunit beta [Antarctobacter sp.]
MKNAFLLTALLAAATPAAAKDLLVTVAKPGNLYVYDAAERALVKDCPMGTEMSPGVIQMSPDGKTAYVLVNRWQDVIGIDIETCEKVFYAAQSTDKITRRSIASLAVAADGSEIYTVRNPTRKLVDRYEVMEPEFAVYAADGGLEAEPVRTYPAPRRSTVMQTGQDGTVYIGGHEIYGMDPASGTLKVAIPNASWDRPLHSPPDVLAFWPIGTQNAEFMLMYTAAVFSDETQTELADFVWGFSSVDLETGDTTVQDFASLEVLMFSGVRDPNAENLLYGVYTQLSKHDVDTRELIKRVDLPHTYYVINISTDGKEIYVAGTNDDIGVYDAETLERIGEMLVPSGGDMGTATLQVVQVD